MSGGRYNYTQFSFENQFVEEFARDLKKWEEYRLSDEVFDPEQCENYQKILAKEFSEETMKEFRVGLLFMRTAVVYANRIDWLLSGDDGEQSFHKRLKEEKEIAMISERNITNQFVPPPDRKIIKVFDAHLLNLGLL